ncbi:glycosyltransferase family 10 (fucosyltransferase) c-term domain-containing protein [Phthorimaea operculella]|nr:glycosyltransferase family 10 (fucosyltransferase) c-term domain-containing protein [Phthorimaea operculella]
MSDMIINDSVPVDKKWGELIKYNIFIMKLVEFVISLVITVLPLIMKARPQGHMYCIATGPTLVISFLFIILYIRRRVPLFMEKMYLFFQILFCFGAFIQCFLLNLVVALLLNIIPHVVDPVDPLHCLVSAPTLMLSLYLMLLYVVDQVLYEAEFYYVILQIILTVGALISVFLVGKTAGAIYGLFYIDLIIALAMDLYYQIKERDFTEHVEIVQRNVIDEAKNPAVIWWNSGYRLFDEVLECPGGIRCDVYGVGHKLPPNNHGAYIFYASRLEFNDLPLPRYPEKVIWALSHEESPRNVVELLHERGLNLFNFSSTFSRYSDVPFPLQYMETLTSITSEQFYVPTWKKNEISKNISPVLFMSSNCYTFTDREKYVKELMKYIPVDSYGTCINNKQWPKDFPEDHLNNLDHTAISNFIARYKFMIAIENGVCEDYITEKFWRPIRLGVVPIYFGSPSVKDWYPNNKSAILVQDYESPKHLSDHLYELIRNDNLYEEYLEHKTKGVITNKKLIEEINLRPYQIDVLATSIEFECFVCKKLHENILTPKVNIVSKKHYNCSKAISALTLEPVESELPFWEFSRLKAEKLYERVKSGN